MRIIAEAPDRGSAEKRIEAVRRVVDEALR